MTFPVYIHLFGHRIHPHFIFEAAGYTVGFQIYRLIRRREKRSGGLDRFKQFSLIEGAIVGALLGAKLLAIVESWPQYAAQWRETHSVLTFLAGKTIVGGLLGGWIGVEIAKRLTGVRRSTGDAFVFPLIIGQCLGRVGCFLTGLDDHTHGDLSSLPWAVDFGDGPRHPTQLYEVAFLLFLGSLLLALRRRGLVNGTLFRLYLLGYLLLRSSIEFIKPVDRHYLGLSAIQVASMIGTFVLAWQLVRRQDRSNVNEQITVTPDLSSVEGARRA